MTSYRITLCCKEDNECRAFSGAVTDSEKLERATLTLYMAN